MVACAKFWAAKARFAGFEAVDNLGARRYRAPGGSRLPFLRDVSLCLARKLCQDDTDFFVGSVVFFRLGDVEVVVALLVAGNREGARRHQAAAGTCSGASYSPARQQGSTLPILRMRANRK